MQKNGQLRICDRCSATEFFECNGEGEKDGGYTRWNTFEKAVGWGKERIGCNGYLDLCPCCLEEYQNRLNKLNMSFMSDYGKKDGAAQ